MSVVPPPPAPRVIETAEPEPAADPVPADADGDGIVAGDECPTEKETTNGFQDGDGCPDEVPLAYLDGDVVKLKEPIVFAGFGLVSPGSNELLVAVAKVMADDPTVERLEVGAHVWGGANPSDNQKTSAARATTVSDELAKRGVAKQRMIARGYGDTCKNAHPGDAQQRVNIVFRVARRDGADTGVAGGCE